ncbi:hypothetical protein QYF61_025641 [Mycteria americana]|uniref:Uncharacterized protein n=1 Tax=Mycteria americana TaxID=33587 RepID=A0AAN7S1R5_MYCAM|nr:hypothetical protein QYF61_025641 [Mycteria americana]
MASLSFQGSGYTTRRAGTSRQWCGAGLLMPQDTVIKQESKLGSALEVSQTTDTYRSVVCHILDEVLMGTTVQ